MATVQEAWALAAADETARERLWRDPASFGAELGLRGAALAELIGGVRFGQRGREAGAAGMELIYAAINVERGTAPWPFTDAPDSEFPHFVSLTEHHTDSIVKRRFYGRSASSTDVHRLAWAIALRHEAISRAESSAEIPPGVADALVAAQGLLDALSREP